MPCSTAVKTNKAASKEEKNTCGRVWIPCRSTEIKIEQKQQDLLRHIIQNTTQ